MNNLLDSEKNALPANINNNLNNEFSKSEKLGLNILNKIYYFLFKFWKFLEESVIFKHKIITLIGIIFIIIVICLAIMFGNLKTGEKQKNYVHFENPSVILNGEKTEFSSELMKDYSYGRNNAIDKYYFFAYYDKKYFHLFNDVAEYEWKYFEGLNLNSSWWNKWHNYGPIQLLAKRINSNTNNVLLSGVYGIIFNSNKKTENVTNFITKITKYYNTYDDNYVYQKITIGDFVVNASDVQTKVLIHGALSDDINVTKDFNYTNLNNSPFIMHIKSDGKGSNPKITIINALLQSSNLSSL